MDDISQAAASAYAGYVATARRAGRRKEWPYVPVIDRDPNERGSERVHTMQVKGRAFATRSEAVADARRFIKGLVASLDARLRDPRHRALREHHGLPREMSASQ